MNEEEKEKQRIEYLNKAIGRRDYIWALLKELKKEYEESVESVKIWSKKDAD